MVSINPSDTVATLLFVDDQSTLYGVVLTGSIEKDKDNCSPNSISADE